MIKIKRRIPLITINAIITPTPSLSSSSSLSSSFSVQSNCYYIITSYVLEIKDTAGLLKAEGV